MGVWLQMERALSAAPSVETPDDAARLRRDVEVIGLQRNDFAARYERSSKLLTDILFHLPPQAVKLDDGRVMMFVDPDPKRTLELIQAALQRAFDAASHKTPMDPEHRREWMAAVVEESLMEESGGHVNVGDPLAQKVAVRILAALDGLPASVRPDAEAIAAVPSLKDKNALVLYFDTKADADEVAALLQEAKPGMRAVHL